MIKLTSLIPFFKKLMSTPENKSRISNSEGQTLEVIPKHLQAINFATVHGTVSAMFGPWGTTFRERKRLIKALHSASNSPVNFPSMSEIPFDYKENSATLYLSPAYNSTINNTLVGFNKEYSSTHWGIIPTDEKNPYHIMRIWRIGLGEFPIGSPNPLGLYVAQPKKGGEIKYFAVARKNEKNSDLQIIESLNDKLEIELMHEVRTAAELLKEYKRERLYVNLGYIERVLRRYPHPSS
jgi:hypothetical protein